MATPQTPSIPQQISASVDIGYLLAKDSPTADEKALIAVSKNGNPQRLEPDDFVINHSRESQEATAARKSSQESFESFRLKVVSNLVLEKAGAVFAKWPDIPPDQLARLVNQESQGVLNISAMLDGLIPALLAQTELNSLGALVFAKTWLILFSFGAAHKSWVDTGQSALLPDNGIDNFIETSLKNLTSGKIKVGLLDERSANETAAAYDAENDIILYPLEFYQNPLAEAMHGAPFAMLIPHEFWHAQQDLQIERLPFGQSEVAAEIISLKALILKMGSEQASLVVDQIAEEKNARLASDFSPFLAQATPKKILAELLLDPQSELSLSFFNIRAKILETAILEMNTGTINQAQREKLARLYMVSKTIGLMLQAMDYFQTKYETDPHSIANPQMTVTMENMTGMVQRSQGYQDDIDYTAVIKTNFEVFSGMREFFMLYDPLNEKPARDYLSLIFIPKLLGPIADTHMEFGNPVDGLAE